MSWKRLRDQKLQERLETRARIIQLIREFFIREGFLEVETPILVPAAGQEPHLNPMKVRFSHSHSELGPLSGPGEESRPHGRALARDPSAVPQDDGFIDAHLITSPEYAHKKLLAAGFEKTFEITRAFRAGEHWGGLHNPEFTILEWYRARADYTKIMEDVERMVQYVAICIFPERSARKARSRRGWIRQAGHRPSTSSGDKPLIGYQGKTIDLSVPWLRLTMAEAFEKYAGMPRKKHAFLCDRTKMRELCMKRGYIVGKDDTYEDLFFKVFLTEIEPKLGYPKPTILYEWPAQMAALARLKPSPDPTAVGSPSPGGRGDALNLPLPAGEGGGEGRVAERFELYIAGMELANAFSELTDADEQRRRFLEEQKLRRKLGKEIIPLDEDFLDAVGSMPPAAGIAFGVDRLVMLLTDAKAIEDVLTFPASQLF